MKYGAMLKFSPIMKTITLNFITIRNAESEKKKSVYNEASHSRKLMSGASFKYAESVYVDRSNKAENSLVLEFVIL